MYNIYKRQTITPVIEKLTGRGLQFSPMVVAGKHITNIGVDRISQSLFCLFSTRRGERFFQPDFGTRIYELLYEPNDFVLCDMIKYYAEEEIKQWETRITATVEAKVKDGANSVEMSVIYSIKGDTNKYSFVYPFNRNVNPLGGDIIE